MPRTARASVGRMVYHVLTRGNGRAEVFHKEEDYVAFLKLLRQALAVAVDRYSSQENRHSAARCRPSPAWNELAT